MATSISNSIGRLGKSLDDHKKGAVPMNLDLDQLTPYRYQARTRMDEGELEDLTESIKLLGIFNPLLVRPLGDNKYEIIAGERRWRAARMAGLLQVPVLVKALDDETVEMIHLAENILRENLGTVDLAQRVQKDFEALNSDLAAVAKKYSKQKSWVSKILSIASGGELMQALVADQVTADRAVLASVASLERKDAPAAEKLVEAIRQAPPKANKRQVAADFMDKAKKEKQAAKSPSRPVAADSDAAKHTKPAEKRSLALNLEESDEPGWRTSPHDAVDRDKTLLIVELSPLSEYAQEYRDLKDEFGEARLSQSKKHANPAYAVVEYGGLSQALRVYRADELRLLKVN